MANQEQRLKIIRQGVEAWNQWREENPQIKPSLNDADFINVDLSDAYDGINLSSADLKRAYFNDSNLRAANLRAADLTDANLRAADLTNANLTNANLTNANLFFANLTNANLTNANLTNANLCIAQALGADFSTATLTGACIEDWYITSRTNLQDIICEYIFTKHDRWKKQFTSRRPHDPNQIFAPGEFTKRYQIVLETVDLFFNDGIDWKAFLASLNNLQTEYGNEVNIQGIEKKAGGTFLVRLEVPSEIDKGAIEQSIKASYEANLQQLEAQYRAELQQLKIQHSDEIITLYRQHNAEMQEITKLLASKPITVEAKAVANQSSSESYTNTFHNSPIGNFANKMQDQASQQTNQYIGANLHEITSLIQALRNQAESFPAAQRIEVIEHLEEVETELKQPLEKRKPNRIKAALLALGVVATTVSGAVSGANEFATQVEELKGKVENLLQIEQ